jgi:hypothetical protein
MTPEERRKRPEHHVDPKVFELCEAGLKTLRQIIRYRDEMKYPD